jgi:hypothetical protein
VQCQGGWLPLQQWWPWPLASNIRKITKEKQMETSTGELIAKLTNISHNLALELRFKEASVIMEAVGALHALPNIAETIRHEWHPSSNSSGPSKGITYISNVTLGKSDE